MIERVVLICPSTSSSYCGSVVLTPTLTFSCAFLPTNIASFSSAPVPTEISNVSSPWILNDLTLLYDTPAPAVITLFAEPVKLKLSSSTFVTINVPSTSPPDVKSRYNYSVPIIPCATETILPTPADVLLYVAFVQFPVGFLPLASIRCWSVLI